MLNGRQPHFSNLWLPAAPAPHQLFAMPRASAVEYFVDHREEIVAAVARNGWILMRGSGAPTAIQFAACMEGLGMRSVIRYPELTVRASATEAQGHGPVFEVTAVPADEAILFHHEGAHTANPCHWIAFHCEQAATTGGQTPLADGAAVWIRLPHELRHAFSTQDLIYERHFIEGLDVPWQRFFGTANRAAVRKLCALEDMDVAFQGNQVLTRIRRPATLLHPLLRVPIFFNQILLHHEACLDPEVRSALSFALDGAPFPRAVRFSNGSEIPAQWIALILNIYEELAEGITWQNGDILIVDNCRFAHARCPYTGARLHHAMLGSPPDCSLSIPTFK